MTGSVLTFVGSAPLLVAGVLFLVALSTSYTDGTEERIAGNLPDQLVYGGGAVAFFVMSVASIVLAMRSLWGRSGARIALSALGVLNIAFDVFAAIRGLSWLALVAVYIVVVLVLYWTGGANAWFRRTK